MIESVTHPVTGDIRVLGIPVKLSDTPGDIRRPPPRLGEDTEHVLAEDLGFTASRVAQLREAGVI